MMNDECLRCIQHMLFFLLIVHRSSFIAQGSRKNDFAAKTFCAK